MDSMEETVIEEKPILSETEMWKAARAGEYVKGMVRLCPDDLIGLDLEGFLDLISQKLTGTEILMDIHHEWAGWDPERKELLCEVSGDPAGVVECMDMIECTICREDAPASSAHLHGNGWIGECCWDDRLHASERSAGLKGLYMAKTKSEKLVDHPFAQVDCPTCGATAGHWCRRPSGHSGPLVEFHAARRKLASEQARARTARELAQTVLEGLLEYEEALKHGAVRQELAGWLATRYVETGNSQSDYEALRDQAETWLSEKAAAITN